MDREYEFSTVFLQEHFSTLHKLPDHLINRSTQNYEMFLQEHFALSPTPSSETKCLPQRLRREESPTTTQPDPASRRLIQPKPSMCSARNTSQKGDWFPPMANTLRGVGRASTRVFLQEHISILQRPLRPVSGLQIHFKRYETFLQEHNAGFCTEFRKPCDILRCI